MMILLSLSIGSVSAMDRDHISIPMGELMHSPAGKARKHNRQAMNIASIEPRYTFDNFLVSGKSLNNLVKEQDFTVALPNMIEDGTREEKRLNALGKKVLRNSAMFLFLIATISFGIASTQETHRDQYAWAMCTTAFLGLNPMIWAIIGDVSVPDYPGPAYHGSVTGRLRLLKELASKNKKHN